MSKQKLPDIDFTWTPQLAYAVGLIVTDGCLSNDGRHIIFRSSEPQLIDTYKKCLGLDNKTGISFSSSYTTNPSYRAQHGNVQMYRWLRKIGISENKTYAIGELSIPDKIFPDFLRGHLDGDGSITTYFDYYNTTKNPKYVYERLWIRFLSASEKHILWLQRRIKQTIGVTGRVHERKPKDAKRVSMYILKFGKKESLRIVEGIYYAENIPCLIRKRKIAEKFIKKINL